MGLWAAQSAGTVSPADDAQLARALSDLSAEPLRNSVASAAGQSFAGSEAGIVHGARGRSRCDLAANLEANTRVHFLGDFKCPVGLDFWDRGRCLCWRSDWLHLQSLARRSTFATFTASTERR